jgi:hypothetical protein
MLTVEKDPYLTPAQIAREFSVHITAISRWCNQGAKLSDGTYVRLKRICLPGSIRVARADLDAFFGALADDVNRFGPRNPKRGVPTPRRTRRATTSQGVARG